MVSILEKTAGEMAGPKALDPDEEYIFKFVGYKDGQTRGQVPYPTLTLQFRATESVTIEDFDSDGYKDAYIELVFWDKEDKLDMITRSRLRGILGKFGVELERDDDTPLKNLLESARGEEARGRLLHKTRRNDPERFDVDIQFLNAA